MKKNTLSRLKPKYGATRRGVIMLWCFSSSLFLYYFAVASSVGESLYFGYLNFIALLFGGSISYHVLIELLKINQSESNEASWRLLLKKLTILQAGYVLAAVSVFSGIKLGGIEGFILAMAGLVSGYFWVMHFLVRAMKQMESLFGIKWFGAEGQSNATND
ncbi:hypothetical protein NA644_20335 [Pseudomonas stutzeri]|nr:hypothetical protein [Stutzerimonas stutzeri]MCQ4251659.1 hypothetical protein [Stutzerimonas stutzeri]